MSELPSTEQRYISSLQSTQNQYHSIPTVTASSAFDLDIEIYLDDIAEQWLVGESSTNPGIGINTNNQLVISAKSDSGLNIVNYVDVSQYVYANEINTFRFRRNNNNVLEPTLNGTDLPEKTLTGDLTFSKLNAVSGKPLKCDFRTGWTQIGNSQGNPHYTFREEAGAAILENSNAAKITVETEYLQPDSLGDGWVNNEYGFYTCDGTQNDVTDFTFQDLVDQKGKTIILTYEIVNRCTGGLKAGFWGSTSDGQFKTAPGVYTERRDVGDDVWMRAINIRGTADFVGTVKVTATLLQEAPGAGEIIGSPSVELYTQTEDGSWEGEEKLENGTFDLDVSGWESSAATLATLTWNQQIEAMGVVTQGTAGAWQAITSTTEDQKYRVKASSSVDASVKHRVRAGNGTDLTDDTFETLEYTSDTDFVLDFTAQSSTSFVYLRATHASTIYWDNVSVKQILKYAPVNTAPIAAPIDVGTVNENAAVVSIDLLSTANDIDGDTLTVSNVTVLDSQDNDVTYGLTGSQLTIEPSQFSSLNTGESETVTVTYDISDGKGGVTQNTSTVVINGLDGPFIWYQDSDGDNYGVDNAGTNVTSYTQPENTSATAGDADDTDATIYPGAPEINDGKDNDQDGEIDEDNTPPLAKDDTGFSVQENGSVVIAVSSLLGNDTDANGDNLTLTSVSDAVNGIVVLDSDTGEITFTPSTGFNGNAGFAYTVEDGFGGSDTAVVMIDVFRNVAKLDGVDDYYTFPRVTLAGEFEIILQFVIPPAGGYLLAGAGSRKEQAGRLALNDSLLLYGFGFDGVDAGLEANGQVQTLIINRIAANATVGATVAIRNIDNVIIASTEFADTIRIDSFARPYKGSTTIPYLATRPLLLDFVSGATQNNNPKGNPTYKFEEKLGDTVFVNSNAPVGTEVGYGTIVGSPVVEEWTKNEDGDFEGFETVQNGRFNGGNSWSANGGGWTFENGKAVGTSLTLSTQALYQSDVFEIGERYRVRYDGTADIGAFGMLDGSNSAAGNGAARITEDISAVDFIFDADIDVMRFKPFSNVANATLDNVSVKKYLQVEKQPQLEVKLNFEGPFPTASTDWKTNLKNWLLPNSGYEAFWDYSIQKSADPDPQHSANNVIKMTWNKTDYDSNPNSQTRHQEIIPVSVHEPYGVQTNDLWSATRYQREHWLGYKVFMSSKPDDPNIDHNDPDNQDNPARLTGGMTPDSKAEFITQWLGIADPGETGNSPPLGLNVRNGTWEVVTRYLDPTPEDPANTSQTRYSLDNGAILTTTDDIESRYPLDQWVKLVFHVRWGYSGDGILEVWKNGEKVINLHNLKFGWNNLAYPYLKIGIYKHSRNSDMVNRVVYFDDILIKNNVKSYAEFVAEWESL